jgi:hypothetical protein
MSVLTHGAQCAAAAPALQRQQPLELKILKQPHFCAVLLCGGSCGERADACTLRTFKNLLSEHPAGCCAQSGPAAAAGDQCGSHECCE